MKDPGILESAMVIGWITFAAVALWGLSCAGKGSSPAYEYTFPTTCLSGNGLDEDKKQQVAVKAQVLCAGKMFDWSWEWRGYCTTKTTVGSIHTIYLNCLGDLP